MSAPPLRRLLQAPRHLLVCERGHARHPRSRHAAHVREHAYNYRVSFLIPECGILPEVLKSTIADVGEYYLVRNLPVHELVAHEFIDAFVKKGSCYALTYNTKIDQDNTAALLPNGKLILSVDKDTYEELGLQGCPSQYSGKKAMRHIITLDLTDSRFHPDSKKHNRVLWALKEKKPLEFDFLLAWYNTGSNFLDLLTLDREQNASRAGMFVAASGPAFRKNSIPLPHFLPSRKTGQERYKFQVILLLAQLILLEFSIDRAVLELYRVAGSHTNFHFRKDRKLKIPCLLPRVTIRALKPKITFSTLRDLPCPVLQSNELQGKPEESCSTEELFEWLGAVLNHVNLDNKSSSFLSTFCCPQPNTMVEKAFLCTITGFIIPEKIIQILEQLCCYFGEPKLACWLTLTVHGFADSPVSWRESEHGFHKGGENLYNFVVFRNLDYWLQMGVGTNDGCPP